MKYEEFVKELEKLKDREIELHMEKHMLVDQYIEELPFHQGDYVRDDRNNAYEVVNVEYDFNMDYFFADVMQVEVEGVSCPEDPDHWEHRRILTFCDEDMLRLNVIKKDDGDTQKDN